MTIIIKEEKCICHSVNKKDMTLFIYLNVNISMNLFYVVIVTLVLINLFFIIEILFIQM